jgi:hypothetical protein
MVLEVDEANQRTRLTGGDHKCRLCDRASQAHEKGPIFAYLWMQQNESFLHLRSLTQKPLQAHGVLHLRVLARGCCRLPDTPIVIHHGKIDTISH